MNNNFINIIFKKSYFYIRIIYIFIVLLFTISPQNSFAQISEHLYVVLPDSLRPDNRNNLTIEETQKILTNAFSYKNWGINEYNEVDSLCLQFAQSDVIRSPEPRRQILLFEVCKYLYRAHNVYRNKFSLRGAGTSYEYPHDEILMKYCNLYLQLYQQYSKQEFFQIPTVLRFKAYLYMENGLYKEAHTTLQEALSLSKKNKNVESILSKYASFALLSEILDMPKQSLCYSDSAAYMLESVNSNSKWCHEIAAYILRLRQMSNFTLFQEKFDDQYANHVLDLHENAKQLPDGDWNGKLLSYSYVLASGIDFYQKNYHRTLARIDSANQIIPNLRMIDGWEMAMVFKGLSLRNLGKIQESNDVIALLDLNDVNRPIFRLVLETLYQEAKEAKNFDTALVLHEQLLQFQKRKHELDMQSKVFEMEKFFNLNQRDQKISQLTSLYNRDFIIVAFISVIIFLFVFIIITLYRSSLTKTAQLINEIYDAEKHLILHIEAARIEERRRLGQELHDGLSATIAATKHHLELAILDSKDLESKNKMQRISNYITDAYQISREKSHLWFKGENGLDEQTFSLQIEILTDRALPSTHYTKYISIQKGALIGISTETKIGLLSIIKESLTNIVKHAKAKKVSILIYQSFNQVVLNIIDDGQGFDSRNILRHGNGIGFQSIEDRVRKMNGNWSINSDADGTVIYISINS